MKKIIYIIPGLGERCDESQYQDLAQALEKKGYRVHQVNPNWYRPLSEQIFPVEKDAIVFGFSFGAIIAYLVAQKYPCKKVLLASLSPLETFSFESLVDDYAEHMSKDLAVEIATDVKKIDISLQSLKTPFVTLAGDVELKDITEGAHILVPGTSHKITKPYIKCILELCE
jgi:alpha/beta superfamily hydrolase